MGSTNKRFRIFPYLVAAPAAVEREIESPVRTAERRGIGIELSVIAAAFPVEERLDLGAFVAAGLEVDHPEPVVAIAEYAIHHVGQPATGRVDPNPVLAVREAMRAEDPAPARRSRRSARAPQERPHGVEDRAQTIS